MSGYSISVDEVRSTCQRLVTETTDVGKQVDAVLAGQVAKDDFGAASAEGVGTAYLAVTHGALVDSLRGFQEVSARLADTLVATFEAYVQADEDARHQF